MNGEFLDIPLPDGAFHGLTVSFVQGVEPVDPARGMRRVPRRQPRDQVIPEEMVPEFIDQRMGQAVLLEFGSREIPLPALVIVHQAFQSLGPRVAV